MAKATKKNTGSTSESGLKYTDKSVGQPALVPVFHALRALLEPYKKGAMIVRGDGNGQFHLWSEKKIVFDGRNQQEMFFAGLLVQKGYVGFYFMPAYTNPEIRNSLSPELLSQLKGKSCFHIKKLDEAMQLHIIDALKKGYALYDLQGWV